MWVPLYGPPLPRRFSGPQLPATKAVYRDLISAPARGNTYRGELLLGFRVTHPFFSEESTPHRTPCDMLPREVFEASVRMCLSLSMCVCHPRALNVALFICCVTDEALLAGMSGGHGYRPAEAMEHGTSALCAQARSPQSSPSVWGDAWQFHPGRFRSLSVLLSVGSTSTGTQRQRNVRGESVWNELVFLPHVVLPSNPEHAPDIFVYLCAGKPKSTNAVCFARLKVGGTWCRVVFRVVPHG